MKIVPGNEVVSQRIPLEQYKGYLDLMPLSCVDLFISYQKSDGNNEMLMVKRLEEPAKGLWWAPGGRIFKNESYEACIERLLQRECGWSLENITTPKQIGNFPFSSRVGIFPDIINGFHALCTCYTASVIGSAPEIVLDKTSGGFAWRDHAFLSGQEKGIHPYLAEAINASGIFKQKLTNIDRSYEI